MSLKEFFKPTRKKIVLSFLVPLIWIFFLLIIYTYNYYSHAEALKSQNAIRLILPNTGPSGYSLYLSALPYMLLGFLINVIYSYPLSCFISSLMDKYKKEKLCVFSAKNIVLLIVLIIIFNPVFLKALSLAVDYTYSVKGYALCGVEIVNFTQISPARDAGVSVGELITAVNGIKISDKSPISRVIANSKPGDEITLETNAKNYTFPMAKNPENNNNPLIGILSKDIYCKR